MKIHKTHTLFLLISLFKLVILCIFSSAFFSDLFYPFVDFFNSTLNNPYQYFLDNHHSDTFPYHALMLYILSPFVALANMLDIQALAKIVLFLADIAIFICFLRLFKHKIKDIYIYICKSNYNLCNLHTFTA